MIDIPPPLTEEQRVRATIDPHRDRLSPLWWGVLLGEYLGSGFWMRFPRQLCIGWAWLGGIVVGVLFVWTLRWLRRKFFPRSRPPRRRPEWNYPLEVLVLLLLGSSHPLSFVGIVATSGWTEPKDVELHFLVLDDATQDAVPGATILLARDNLRGKHTIHTGPDGTAAIVVSCVVHWHQGLFTHVASVYPGWEIKVKKEGYQEGGPQWREWGYDEERSPPLLVRLERERQP
jgi:hypothetical protein